MEYIQTLNPIIQAFLATLLTWLITALGSSIVFLFKKVNKNWLDGMLAASAGIMLAASFWSLLLPGITQAENLGLSLPLIITVGILSGGLLLIIGNKVCDTIGKKQDDKQKRIRMLITSITIHNIPEGLAIGVAFGSVIYGLDGATLLAAWTLAIGIGIQNFPEGSAISLPLKREGASAKKSILSWTVQWNCRTDFSRNWSTSRHENQNDFTIPTLFCSRCHDLCSRYGTNTRKSK